jgi:hypothetical protein
MRLLFVVLAILCASPAQAEPYFNSRFGYSLDVPKLFTLTDPDPENGDGRAYSTKDKTVALSVYGSHILQDSFAAEIKSRRGFEESDGWKITYESVVNRNVASFTGEKEDRIFYARFITVCGGSSLGAYRVEYPKKDLKRFRSVIRSMNKSLRDTGKGCM